MGMKDYKKFKLEQQIKESETISLLIKRIDELEQQIKKLEVQNQTSQVRSLTEDEQKKLKAIQDQKMKPEDFIKMFTNDMQEFNPNAE